MPNQRLYVVRAKGGSPTNGLVMGYGNATTRYATGTADARFLDFNFENSATSGDNRGMYLRLFHTGAGGGGEAARIFTTVNANIGTAHGAHISMNFLNTAGASECSGLGVATRSTLHIPAVASWAPTGTYSAIQAEIYSDGSTSDPAGMTELSFFRVVNGGNATGGADVDTDAHVFSLQGFSDAAGNVFKTGAPTTLGASFRVKVGSTTYYVPLYTTQSST